jgi:malate/lactate dehydrogenase
MTSPIKVCVTGAAGQIAYSFLPLLLTGQVFGERKVELRLLDIVQCENTMKGVIMELNDGVFPFL